MKTKNIDLVLKLELIGDVGLHKGANKMFLKNSVTGDIVFKCAGFMDESLFKAKNYPVERLIDLIE